MHSKSLMFCIVLAGGCVSSEPSKRAPGQGLPQHRDFRERREVSDPYHQFIFFAVLEGLYQDGLSDEAIDRIIPRPADKPQFDFHEHFIYACPLCHPAFEAFRLYRLRSPVFYGDKAMRNTFGKGLDEATLDRLKSDEKSVRLKAIQQMIKRWVGRRMKLMRLTAEEHQKWIFEIKKRKSQAMKTLESFQAQKSIYNRKYSGWKECAICEGSVEGAALDLYLDP